MDGCGINNKVGSRKNVFCLLTVENLCAKRSQVAGSGHFLLHRNRKLRSSFKKNLNTRTAQVLGIKALNARYKGEITVQYSYGGEKDETRWRFFLTMELDELCRHWKQRLSAKLLMFAEVPPHDSTETADTQAIR